MAEATGYFYSDCCRKNIRRAIFTARFAVTIASTLYLRRCTNSKEGAQSSIHSLPEINLNINFKAQIVKLKLTLTLFLTLTDTGGTVLTIMLGYRSLYIISDIGTPQNSLHRVTIRNDSPGLAGRGEPNRRSKSIVKLFDK